jgi:hypothetical protein
MWALAAGTAFTLYQRMRAVFVDAKAKSAAQPTTAEPPTPEPATAQPPTAEPAPAQSEEA